MVITQSFKECLVGCCSMWAWIYTQLPPISIAKIEVSSDHVDGTGGHTNSVSNDGVFERQELISKAIGLVIENRQNLRSCCSIILANKFSQYLLRNIASGGAFCDTVQVPSGASDI